MINIDDLHKEIEALDEKIKTERQRKSKGEKSVPIDVLIEWMEYSLALVRLLKKEAEIIQELKGVKQ